MTTPFASTDTKRPFSDYDVKAAAPFVAPTHNPFLNLSAASSKNPHIQSLATDKPALARLCQIYEKPITITARLSEEEAKVYTTPITITFTLKELDDNLFEALTKANIIKKRPYIVGSGANHILLDTPFKDIDINFHLLDTPKGGLEKGFFQVINIMVLNFLKSKLSEDFKKKIGSEYDLNQFITDHFFSKRKLVIDPANPAKNLSIMGFGPELDVKFSRPSQLTRHTIAPSDGLHVCPSEQTAHCVHLGEVVGEEIYKGALVATRFRKYYVVRPEEIRDLIFRLSLVNTRAWEVQNSDDLYAAAYRQFVNEYSTADLNKKFPAHLNSHYHPKNIKGRELNFLNLLHLIAIQNPKDENEHLKKNQYIQALAAAWQSTHKEALPHLTALLHKHPEDAKNLLILAQGIFLFHWMKGDPTLTAYDLTEFIENPFTPRMHMRVNHPNGIQYLMLPHPPTESVVHLVQCLSAFPKKYESSGCFEAWKALPCDLGFNKMTLEHPDDLIGDLIQSFEAPHLEKILQRQFKRVSKIAFYETLAKLQHESKHTQLLQQRILHSQLDRCADEAHSLKLVKAVQLILCLRELSDLDPTSGCIQRVNKGLQTIAESPLEQSLFSNKLFKTAFACAISLTTSKVAKQPNPQMLASMASVLMLAEQHDLLPGDEAQKLLLQVFESLKQVLPRDNPSLIADITRLVCSNQLSKFKSADLQRTVGEITSSLKQSALPAAVKLISTVKDNPANAGHIPVLFLVALDQNRNIVKGLCIEFMQQVCASNDISAIKTAATAVLDLRQRGIEFTSEESANLQALFLEGMSTCFSGRLSAIQSHTHYQFLATAFTKLPQSKPQNCESVRSVSLVNFETNPSLALKTHLQALIHINFPLATTLFYQKSTWPFSPADREEVLLEFPRYRIASDNSSDAKTSSVQLTQAFYEWNSSTENQYSKAEAIWIKRLDNTVLLIETFTSRCKECQTHEQISKLVDSLCDSLLLIVRSPALKIESSYLTQRLNQAITSLIQTDSIPLLILAGRLVVVAKETKLLSTSDINTIYLSLIPKICVGTDLNDQLLTHCFDHIFSQNLAQHPQGRLLASLVLNCVHQFLKSGHLALADRALDLNFSFMNSDLIPAYWEMYENVCVLLFSKTLQADKNNQKTSLLKKIVDGIIAKGCLKITSVPNITALMTQSFIAGKFDICNQIWAALIALPAPVELLQTISEMMVKHQPQAAFPLVTQAVIGTRYADTTLGQHLYQTLSGTPIPRAIPFINDMLANKLLDRILLVEKNAPHSLRIVIRHFIQVCQTNGASSDDLKTQWGYLKPILEAPTLLVEKKAFQNDILMAFVKNGSVCFIVEAIQLLPESSDLFPALIASIIKIPAKGILEILSSIRDEALRAKVYIEVMSQLINSTNTDQLLAAAELTQNLPETSITASFKVLRALYSQKSPNSQIATAQKATLNALKEKLPACTGGPKEIEFVDALRAIQSVRDSLHHVWTFPLFCRYLELKAKDTGATASAAGGVSFSKTSELLHGHMAMLAASNNEKELEQLDNLAKRTFEEKEMKALRVEFEGKLLRQVKTFQATSLADMMDASFNIQFRSFLLLASRFTPPVGREGLKTLMKNLTAVHADDNGLAFGNFLDYADRHGIYPVDELKLRNANPLRARDLEKVGLTRVELESQRIQMLLNSLGKDFTNLAKERFEILREMTCTSNPHEWQFFLNALLALHDHTYIALIALKNEKSYLELQRQIAGLEVNTKVSAETSASPVDFKATPKPTNTDDNIILQLTMYQQLVQRIIGIPFFLDLFCKEITLQIGSKIQLIEEKIGQAKDLRKKYDTHNYVFEIPFEHICTLFKQIYLNNNSKFSLVHFHEALANAVIFVIDRCLGLVRQMSHRTKATDLLGKIHSPLLYFLNTGYMPKHHSAYKTLEINLSLLKHQFDSLKTYNLSNTTTNTTIPLTFITAGFGLENLGATLDEDCADATAAAPLAITAPTPKKKKSKTKKKSQAGTPSMPVPKK